jgi:ABC-type branched-subunit amino acid transport system substrate-binding protein
MLDSYAPKEQARLVEYYEGFLMAVEELKREGYSFIINTYDAGPKDKSLDSLFASGALDYTELIIGATYSSHTKELAQFAKKNEIPLVIPFSSKTEEAIDNPMVFVASSVNSYVVPKVCTKFVEEFSTANIVFVDDAKNGNKTEFINALKAELDKNSIQHRTIDMKQVTSTVKELQANKKSVVVVPTSASATTLNTILPSLIDAKGKGKIILFGYPEWQIHAKNTRNMMYEIDTYFYATFYSNEVFPSVNHFQKSFVNWYNHGIQNIYPRYGMLGYDTGRFFLLAASKYGKELGMRINETPSKPIQSAFLFERIGEDGGYVNTKYFFVHYTPKYTVDRIDYDKAENSNTTGGFDTTNNTEENQEFDFNSGVSEDTNTATDTEQN